MKLKINELKPNTNNPRIIKDIKFKKLVQSIKDFPEMLELRPIVVDEDMTILGGNMRYKACVEAGLKEVYVKIAKGLTEEQKQEFIIKDNVGFGDWEWNLLANEWDSVQLTDWGLDVWQNQDDVFDEENIEDINDIIEIDNVVVTFTMPKYEYDKAQTEINQLTEKYPNIQCRIQN